jgi:hypothetical protein
MTATNTDYECRLDRDALELALRSLAIRLEQNQAELVELVVCGGAALILVGLVPRTTRDVDIVALMRQGILCSPDPLPAALMTAIMEVAEDLNIPGGWLNNGPSRGMGGLFQMGLPSGFAARLRCIPYGDRLAVHLVHRTDQIHFKLYAAADRGGYHITDLQALAPAPDELATAARWTMTHDVSVGFAAVLRNLLRSLGHGDLAERL